MVTGYFGFIFMEMLYLLIYFNVARSKQHETVVIFTQKINSDGQ